MKYISKRRAGWEEYQPTLQTIYYRNISQDIMPWWVRNNELLFKEEIILGKYKQGKNDFLSNFKFAKDIAT